MDIWLVVLAFFCLIGGFLLLKQRRLDQEVNEPNGEGADENPLARRANRRRLQSDHRRTDFSEDKYIIDVSKRKSRPSVVGTKYIIDYVDRNSNVSKRKIELKSVNIEFGKIYIDAFCFSSNDSRCFRADRIRKIVVEKTGDVIENPSDYFSVFAKKDDAHDNVMKRARNGINILNYISRIDGIICEDEINMQIEYISDRVLLHSGSVDFNKSAARQFLKSFQSTDDVAIKSAIAISGSREAALVKQYVEKIKTFSNVHDIVSDEKISSIISILDGGKK